MECTPRGGENDEGREVSMEMELKFVYQKETTGTYRYAEVHDEKVPPVVGTLYIRKYAIEGARPERLTVTIKGE